MMNKSLLLILILISIRGIGQKKDYIPVETPLSPEAYSFSKISNNDIDFIHGKANITIPLYEINDKGIKIPIALTYNSGGIRLNEVASSVGLGWTLSLSNNIGKEIRDKEDDYFPNKWIPTSEEINQLNGEGVVIKNNLGSILYETPILQKVFRSIGCSDYDPDFDTSSDIYSYSTPSTSGSFIIDALGTIHTIPNNNDKIQATNNGFVITDTQATKYFFSRSGLSISSPQYIIGFSPGDDIPSTGGYSNYKLDSIRNIYNNQVQYKYLRQNILNTKNKVEQISILVKRPPSNSLHGQAAQDKYKAYNMVTSSIESLITEIVFSQGRVLFIYSDENNKINNYGYRLDLQEKDTPFNSNSPVALKEIKVLNNSNKLVKHYTFNYDYFISFQAIESPEKYRLKLLSIEDKLTGSFHNFDYYEDFNMPSRDSNSRDYWGYYNGINNSTSIPKYSTSMYIGYLPFYYSQGADMNANDNYSKTYSLKTITFPTGAKQKFSYEGNKVFGKSPYVSLVSGNSDILIAENNSIYTTAEKNIVLPEQIIDELDPISGESFKLNFQSNQSTGGNQQLETFCVGSLINLDENNNRTVILPSITNTSNIDLLSFKNLFKTNKFILKIEQEGNCSCSMKVDYNYYNKLNEDTEFLVGGNRISEIELIDGVNSYKTKYKYNYVDENTNSLTNKSSGYLFAKSSNLKKVINQEANSDGSNTDSENKSIRYIIYNNPLSGMSSSFQNVKYKNVRLITEGKGYIDYKFNLPDNTENFMINDYYSIIDEGKYNLLREKRVYDENNKLLKKVIHSYEFDETKNALSANKRLNYIYFNINLNTYLDRVLRDPLKTEYRYRMSYELVNYENSFHKSVNEESLEYPKGILNYKISKITTREYNTSNINKPFVLSKEIVTYLDKSNITKFTYPFELNYNQLNSLNYLSPIINENSLNNNMTSKIETEYNNLSIFPTGIKTYSLSGNISSLEVSYDKYDSKGNILQYSEKGLKPTTIIWGYNQTQPIAKIEGITYNSLMALSGVSTLINDAISKSNLDVDATTEQTLLTALTSLRNNSSLSNYTITTFTYDPLIGVTTITQPNGIREIYKYDSANRLQSVVDMNGKILKEYQYNYKQ